MLWWVFAPLACDVDEAGFDALLRELRERVKDEQMRAELGATMRVIAERDPRHPGFGERISAILGEEILMQSEFLRSIREKTRAETRREELLKVAARLVNQAQLDELHRVEDIDALEARVMSLLDACVGKRGSDEDR